MLFAVGMPKTGTASMAAALGRLGLRTAHYPPGVTRSIICVGDFERQLADLDAVANCAEHLYDEYDRVFPGSRFILTTRPEDEWLESCRRFYFDARLEEIRRNHLEAFLCTFGIAEFRPEVFMRRYREHNRGVREYFDGTGRLLEFRIGEDGWTELCGFLTGLEVSPEEPFPHENRGGR